ncbi:MAG: uracil-DNA glycosylase [bacterium]
MTQKQTKLDEIENKILANNVTPELASSATQLVFGSGNPDAQIVIIGEAPGKKEDLLGQPFVGAAGKFLDEMLGTIGFERKDIYITNIVKYRPPNNRDPLPEEKSAFLPYLESQLEVIRPKLIITLGRHSLNCFLPDLIISKVHGQLQKFNERFLLPLYHPAAALYNGGLRQTLIEDFRQIPLILSNIK